VLLEWNFYSVRLKLVTIITWSILISLGCLRARFDQKWKLCILITKNCKKNLQVHSWPSLFHSPELCSSGSHFLHSSCNDWRKQTWRAACWTTRDGRSRARVGGWWLRMSLILYWCSELEMVVAWGWPGKLTCMQSTPLVKISTHHQAITPLPIGG
jgi:hypothetical protein